MTHLNHGSFGAAPRDVLAHQTDMRRRLESNPVRFYTRDLPHLLDAARHQLAQFIGADPAGVAFVPNVSSGVNAVLRSLTWGPGDELLVTNHGYGAARNAAAYVAGRAGGAVVVAEVPASPRSAAEICEAVVAAATDRTRLAMVDHITSATAVVFPIAAIVQHLAAHGIPTLVDGAHAPGMLDLDVEAVGAAYYAGNCHKWLCAPKGAGFLHVADAATADALVPVVAGWGLTSRPKGRSQFHANFDWVGTDDPTPYLSVPVAIDVMGGLLPGGWEALRQRNHDLVVRARRLLCDRLGVAAVVPDELLGSMATVPLPDAMPPQPLEVDPLQARLSAAGFEVPVTHGPGPEDRWLRISAQAYNDLDDYERLALAM